jgi:hypothetical protein
LEKVAEKREEILSKKGFVTKEDEESIENSVLDDLKRNNPSLWQTLELLQQQEL